MPIGRTCEGAYSFVVRVLKADVHEPKVLGEFDAGRHCWMLWYDLGTMRFSSDDVLLVV